VDLICEDDDESAVHCFMHHTLPVPLDRSWAIYMCFNDNLYGGGSFMVFHALAAPHAARIRRLRAHVFGDRAYELAARDFVLSAFEHFSLRMSEYGFNDDSCDGALPSQSSFAEPASLSRLTCKAALPLETHLSPSIRSLTLTEWVVDLDALFARRTAPPRRRTFRPPQRSPLHLRVCPARARFTLAAQGAPLVPAWGL
jgi:hypothetical protein